jgi:hypothetical protein
MWGKIKMAHKILSKVAVIAMVITAVALSVSTYAALSIDHNITTDGTISTSPNIGVFSDSGCTQSITSLNWGSVAPGNSATTTVYVKNTGTGASITLSLTSLNLSPAGAVGHITVTWDKAGATLSPGQSTSAVITLSVDGSINDVSTFSVTVRITGTVQ